MNYIGSKKRLSRFIIGTIKKYTEVRGKRFFEPFAGTGIISSKLKSELSEVTVNDIELYSYTLLRHYIGNNNHIRLETALVSILNDLEGVSGIVHQNYCPGGSGRKYFTDTNGKKIDAVRQEIAEMLRNKEIDDDQFYFLLTSLIESADKRANVASVYGAYLKRFKKSALKDLIIEPAKIIQSKAKTFVYQEDANLLSERITGDIVYLDPPYNRRQYGANYHVLNTIAEYTPVETRGVTGLRDYYRSPYCQKNATDSLYELVGKLSKNFEYIFLSYNDEGIINRDDIKRIFLEFGEYGVHQMEYSRFKADNARVYKRKKTNEFIHVGAKSLGQ